MRNYVFIYQQPEFFFERPNINGSPAPNLTKPDVGYDHFYQCQSASTPSGTPSLVSGTASTTEYTTMISTDLSRYLASPGPVDSNGVFDDTWFNYN